MGTMKAKKLRPAREKLLRRVLAGDLLICGMRTTAPFVEVAWFQDSDRVTSVVRAALDAGDLKLGPKLSSGWHYLTQIHIHRAVVSEKGKAALANMSVKERRGGE